MANEIKGHDEVDEWEYTMFLYKSALKKVTTKIEILKEEFHQLYKYNPIEHISTRIKTPESIVKKLHSDGHEVSISSMVEHLNDIAGIRVICSFTQDMYVIAEMIGNQDDVTVVAIKDYLKHPKANGYRSYHMIITIPVYLASGTVQTKVEIQIRTIAMDFWASLEHKMRYKLEGNAPEHVYSELKDCAEMVAQLDEKMLALNNIILKEAEKMPEPSPDTSIQEDVVKLAPE